MARFFFNQIQTMELITEGGNPSGGAVVATLVWMRALHELGHVVLLGRFEDDNRPILEEYSWIQTVPIFHPEKGLPKVRWATYRFPQFLRVLKECKCDYLIESIPSWSSFTNSLLCKLLKIKQVIRVANDNMLDERIKLTHNLFEQKFISLGFRFSNFVLTQNDFQYGQLKGKFPYKPIIKLSNPIILEGVHSKLKPEKKSYIAWLANFRYQKNLKLLFEIVKRSPNEMFKVAGVPLYPLDSETKDYLSKLKQLPNIEFMGKLSRQEVPDFLFRAKYLLNTSRYEGFSNTFLESMLVGTPILTTKNVNPDEIILKFDLGMIYTNEEDLGQLITSISEDDYLRKSMNCINYLKTNHDHLVLGNKLLEFLHEK
jgi:glycosyltransferase involved in cell wall biosynthesis